MEMIMERDPLLDQLRALPTTAPSPALDLAVRSAAQQLLSPLAPPSLFYRALAPTLLSGLTAGYLFWAFQAAGALY
jgi:hypothetical protein